MKESHWHGKPIISVLCASCLLSQTLSNCDTDIRTNQAPNSQRCGSAVSPGADCSKYTMCQVPTVEMNALVGHDHGSSTAGDCETPDDTSEQPCQAEREVMLFAIRTMLRTALPIHTISSVESWPTVACFKTANCCPCASSPATTRQIERDMVISGSESLAVGILLYRNRTPNGPRTSSTSETSTRGYFSV